MRIHNCRLFFRLFIILSIFFLITLIGAKLLNLDKNKAFLTLLSRYYFDKQYYLTHYPEVKNLNILPFEHYNLYGWKEGKNPNKDFDTKFYEYFYLNSKNNHYTLTPLQHYVYSKLYLKARYTKPQESVIKPLKNPKYYLAMVAIFQDEARFLKEWIEFHRLVGVEHFYLYNHLSQDNYKEVLEPYIKENIVECHDITTKPKNRREWRKLQTGLYSQITKKVAHEVEWLAVIDTDEFLFPTHEKRLDHFLKAYDNYPALSVNWKLFGSGNILKVLDNQLMIEKLVYANPLPANYVKTIVKPRYVDKFRDPHYPLLQYSYPQIYENLKFFYGDLLPTESREHIRINHYWARDLDFFENTKLKRLHILDINSTKDKDAERIRKKIIEQRCLNEQSSTQRDESILMFVPELNQRIFGNKE